MYMPIDALVLSGFAGFSVNFVILPSSSAVMIPKREASSIGTSMTAMVQSAFFFLWKSSIFE